MSGHSSGHAAEGGNRRNHSDRWPLQRKLQWSVSRISSIPLVPEQLSVLWPFAAKAVREDLEQPLEDRKGQVPLIYPRPAGVKRQEDTDFTSLSRKGSSGYGVICALQYHQKGKTCIISVSCQN